MRPVTIVAFWRDAGWDRWFTRNADFDRELESRFRDAHFAAARGEHDDWMDSAEGALALMILLDQVPRNIFRGSAHSYATDGLALAHARRAVDRGLDRRIEPDLRTFLYLPFEHSEDGSDQQRSVDLFRALAQDSGDERVLTYALLHQDIIARFGRFPHRNRALGRVTTAAEQAFLDEGGFSG